MVIDLIIPTYKPGDKFQESLKRLALQTRKPDRIILVNTEAEFFDEKMITPYDNVEVHHIKKEEFDHGKTRDYGASLAKEADILMFMTDDAIPKDKYMVENLIKAFDDPMVTAAYGRQILKKIILSIIQESLIILWKAELKRRRIWILWESKHFSVQMYAVLIEDQSMMQWEVSSIKQSLTRT